MTDVKTEVPRLTEERDIHETIVDAIRRCRSPSSEEILHLFQLIKDTKILAGHDAIIAEIDKFFDSAGANKWARDLREVRASLYAKKQAAAEKAAGEKKQDGTTGITDIEQLCGILDQANKLSDALLQSGNGDGIRELDEKTAQVVDALTHTPTDTPKRQAAIHELAQTMRRLAKTEALKPAVGEKKVLEPGTNLYELELKTKALISVLTHPQSDGTRWNASIREQVEIVHKITGKALGK